MSSTEAFFCFVSTKLLHLMLFFKISDTYTLTGHLLGLTLLVSSLTSFYLQTHLNSLWYGFNKVQETFQRFCSILACDVPILITSVGLGLILAYCNVYVIRILVYIQNRSFRLALIEQKMLPNVNASVLMGAMSPPNLLKSII